MFLTTRVTVMTWNCILPNSDRPPMLCQKFLFLHDTGLCCTFLIFLKSISYIHERHETAFFDRCSAPLTILKGSSIPQHGLVVSTMLFIWEAPCLNLMHMTWLFHMNAFILVSPSSPYLFYSRFWDGL
jgi:hypothetical protein